jgi:hypothetical protein
MFDGKALKVNLCSKFGLRFWPQLAAWSLVLSLLSVSISNVGGTEPFKPGQGGRVPSPVMKGNGQAMACSS